MNDLAVLYWRQGRYVEAGKTQKETLEAVRRVLEQDHPQTLASIVNLALVYASQGRYAQAEQLYKETLELQRRVLGENHPFTVRSMYGLACLAALRSDRGKSLDWLQQAVERGYSDSEKMATDDDLKSLRGTPEFEALVTRARENAAKSK